MHTHMHTYIYIYIYIYIHTQTYRCMHSHIDNHISPAMSCRGSWAIICFQRALAARPLRCANSFLSYHLSLSLIYTSLSLSIYTYIYIYMYTSIPIFIYIYFSLSLSLPLYANGSAARLTLLGSSASWHTFQS